MRLRRIKNALISVSCTISETFNYHRDIFEFIRARDSKEAEDKMRQHLYDVTKRIEKNMKVDHGSKSLFELNENIKK